MENKNILISNGIILHMMKTDRFKTNYMVFTFKEKLSRENVTKNALLPLVLRRGCQKYPTMQDIAIKLEEMYGASFDANTDKVGDYSVIQFMMDTISDEYTLDKSSVMSDAIELFNDILFNPIVENDAFKEEYVEQEKETLKEIINSRINDKASYAFSRAVEEMYKNEPYGLYKYGYVEDLEKISAKDLYNHYLELLNTAEVDIYFSGNLNEEMIVNKYNELFEKIKRNYTDNRDEKVLSTNDRFSFASNEIVESQNVTQGKLVLGYNFRSQNLKDDFYKMTVYSAILGGTASSKLFNNVREKKSLAYTISSQYIKHKGALFVSAGIELSNFSIAKESILKEIDDMKNGVISDEELDSAKANLITRFKSFNDSQVVLIGWAIGQEVLDGDMDLELVINNIEAVTKEDVIEVASKLDLQISYFLTNKA